MVLSRSKDQKVGKSTQRTLALAIGALGVMFGDVGTSPLYAVNELFSGANSLPFTDTAICGGISLIIWAITTVITIKYILVVLEADNAGEGGVFALYGLLLRFRKGKIKYLLIAMLLSAGLLFGDGMITPAVSVLAAVEGLGVLNPSLTPYVVPITVLVLVALFAMQRGGTSKLGRVFGPIIMGWFVLLATMGVNWIVAEPKILAALNPWRGFSFLLVSPPVVIAKILGAVMLSITGGEALYADLGHFGKGAVRSAWFVVVYPALLLNYLGQGAFLLSGNAITGHSLFFSMVPRSLLVATIVLATLACVIASQALIAGAFSLVSQGVALGALPRVRIVQTHHEHAGQVYVPIVNTTLLIGSVLLVISFGSSHKLAAAYGLAASADMLTTSIAVGILAHLIWGWGLVRAVMVFGALALLDLIFLSANLTKFLAGGFIPVSVGFALFAIMLTWRWGRKAVYTAYSGINSMSMRDLIQHKAASQHHIDRKFILMVPKPIRSEDQATPALLQLLWNRYGVLPKHLVFVEISHARVPFVTEEDRYDVKVFYKDSEQGSIISVTIRFGFMQDPNVEKVLEGLAVHREIDLPVNPHRWIVYTSFEHVLAQRGISLFKRLRVGLYRILRRLSVPGHYYYGLGDQVQLSVVIVPVHIG